MHTSTATSNVPDGCRCSGCGCAYRQQQWMALPVSHVLLPEQLGALVTNWPKGAWIEVRVCDRCGKPIAQIERGSRRSL